MYVVGDGLCNCVCVCVFVMKILLGILIALGYQNDFPRKICVYFIQLLGGATDLGSLTTILTL